MSEVVRIIVDNRVRLHLDDLCMDLAERLRDSFTYDDPSYRKKRLRYFAKQGIDLRIRSWKHEGDFLTVPRGSLNKVRNILGRYGSKWTIQDNRTEGDPSQLDSNESIPEHEMNLYDYQEEVVSKAIQMQNCLVRAPTGCLSGNTIIECKRGEKIFHITIARLVERYNTERWYEDESQPEIAVRADSGHVCWHVLKDALKSGLQHTYLVRTESDNSVRATANHRFLTTSGWKRLFELTIGDKLFVENESACTVVSNIAAIESHGIEHTYDLEMMGEPHNFVANGIVVHNSGKTTAALAIVSRLNLPTLVIVWSSNLFEQWIARLKKELGLKLSDIGRLQGSKGKLKPITIAMQQTLAARGVNEALSKTFGLVICDEVQRFAARTMFDAIDPFHAKYRIGISADETRTDRKEFLIYDLFGRIAADVKQEDLIASGHVMDVQIFAVPTDFKADWYSQDNDFNRLLDDIMNDEVRNETILRIAEQEVRSGHQVMLFTHRVEHARRLDRELVMRGIKCGVMLGGVDYAATFRETRKGLEDGTIRAAVGTIQAIGQGIDIPRLNTGILVTPVSSRQQLNQVRGRMCRTADGKDAARLYYLWDKHVYGKGAIERLCKVSSTVHVQTRDNWTEAKEYLKDVAKRRLAGLPLW